MAVVEEEEEEEEEGGAEDARSRLASWRAGEADDILGGHVTRVYSKRVCREVGLSCVAKDDEMRREIFSEALTRRVYRPLNSLRFLKKFVELPLSRNLHAGLLVPAFPVFLLALGAAI